MQISEIKTRYAELEPETSTGEIVQLNGRLMLRRKQGKIMFGNLVNNNGGIQLFCIKDHTSRYPDICKLQIGDWISVKGEIVTTATGELSVKVEQWEVLAATQHSFPDKWNGITDPDTRYRQRYLDTWVSPKTRQDLINRSKIISLTRRFMEDLGYMEVETPILHSIPSGADARSFETYHNALDQDFHLRIAPELFLKRLVVAGFPKVFEIGRVFRNEGVSPRHNPEFTMMECYESPGSYQDHMALTESLVRYLCHQILGSGSVVYSNAELDFDLPWHRMTMAEAVSAAVDVDLSIHSDLILLRDICLYHGVAYSPTDGAGKLLSLLFEELVEITLIKPTFITEYPTEISPLAKACPGDPLLTERFEGFVYGRELCNGFSELTDPVTQRERFEQQNSGSVDTDYIRALEYGLPPTVGLGIGIDRLVMILTNNTNIKDVLAFPTLSSK